MNFKYDAYQQFTVTKGCNQFCVHLQFALLLLEISAIWMCKQSAMDQLFCEMKKRLIDRSRFGGSTSFSRGDSAVPTITKNSLSQKDVANIGCT